MSSFEIDKMNLFPALTTPFSLTFSPYLFIAFEVKLFTNPSKFSLAKGAAIFVSPCFPKLYKQKPKHPTDWIILDIQALLSFISL